MDIKKVRPLKEDIQEINQYSYNTHIKWTDGTHTFFPNGPTSSWAYEVATKSNKKKRLMSKTMGWVKGLLKSKKK